MTRDRDDPGLGRAPVDPMITTNPLSTATLPQLPPRDGLECGAECAEGRYNTQRQKWTRRLYWSSRPCVPAAMPVTRPNAELVTLSTGSAPEKVFARL